MELLRDMFCVDMQYVASVTEVRYSWSRLASSTNTAQDQEFTLLQRRTILPQSGLARLMPVVDLENENSPENALFDTTKATMAKNMFYLQFPQDVKTFFDQSEF